MEEQVERLVNKVWEKFKHVPASQRYLIAVAGIPGSGKTTLASTLSTRLNALHSTHSPATSNSSPLSTFIPMDGFHLTRTQLSALPDPHTAFARRGAPFTFNGPSFLSLVQSLRSPILPETSTLYAPSFSHALKDPVENDIAIPPSVRIVVFEGNYCALDKAPWSEAAGLMDEVWFVDVDFEVARRRLVERHVVAGIAVNEHEAGRRADENDLVNGREIVENRVQVCEIVKSLEDSGWAPEKQGVRDEKRDKEKGMVEYV